MKHSVTRRVAASALSAVLVVGGLPTHALAEALDSGHALTTQGIGTWEHDGKAWHYRLPDGTLGTGWHEVDGTWYLFDASGNMLTGWQADGDTAYRLGESGGMWRSRWACEGGEWLYLLPSGAAATGWVFVDGAWYYFDPATGLMAHDTEVDGFYLRSDGAWDNDASPDMVLADVSTTDVVDPVATSALITLTADEAHPFAEAFSTATLELGGGLDAGFTIKDAKRTSTHTAQVTLEGAFAQGETEGAGIVLLQGSFADPKAASICPVGVSHIGATLVLDESSYDEATGTYQFVIDSGSAQLLSDGVTLSFPKSWGAEVLGAEYERGSRRGAFTVSFAAAEDYDQLAELDDALDDGDVLLCGTSAGDVPVTLTEGDYVSLLDYLLPSGHFYVERGAEGKGWTLADDGGATVVLRLRVEPLSGEIDLSQADLSLMAEGADASDWKVVDAHTLEFVCERLTADQLSQLKAEYAVEDTAEFLDAYAYVCGAEVAEGVQLLGGVTDEWGLELPEGYELPEFVVFNNVGLGETGELEDPLAEDEASSLQTQASALTTQDSTQDSIDRITAAAKNSIAFGTMSSLIGAIAGIVGNAAGIMSSAESNPFAGLSKSVKIGLASGVAVAGLLGTLGTALSAALSPSGVGIPDIMNEVVSAQSKAGEISGQLGSISKEIGAIRDQVDFATKSGRLTELCNKANSYSPWVTRAIKAGKDAPDRETFDLMKDDPESSETGKALKALRDQTVRQTEMNGGKVSAYNVADDLAGLIVGDANLNVKGVVESYFDYTGSKVNWDSEAFYARQLFVNYVSYAFFNAYTAAMNELKWDYREAGDDDEREEIADLITNLYVRAAQVGELIGDQSNVTLADGKTKGKPGVLLARTKDRADGKVLCNVNGRAYPKTKGSTEHKRTVIDTVFPLTTKEETYYTSDNPAVRPVLIDSTSSEFRNTFSDLLKERDEEHDKEFSNPSTMSASDFATMASRQAFVRRQPGFDAATSIYAELILVGIVAQNHGKVSSNSSLLNESGYWKDYLKLNWITDAQYYWALTGDTSLTNKSDSPSISHVRVHSAEMYDMVNNKSLGKQLLYKFDVYYKGVRWRVDLDINTPMVFN